jgi:hypothetical protein
VDIEMVDLGDPLFGPHQDGSFEFAGTRDRAVKGKGALFLGFCTSC